VSLHQNTESFANWLKMARQVACCWVMAVLFSLCGIAEAQTVYFHNDIAGTPIAASDESGNLLWQESYRPYGERMLKPAAAKSNSQWFHGKSTDADTGMEDFGARNYDPVLGRFLSIDPVDFSEKSIHSFNRYAYGNNNPNRYVDPDGRFAVPLIVGLALWAGAELFLPTPAPPADAPDAIYPTTLPDGTAALKGVGVAVGIVGAIERRAATTLGGVAAKGVAPAKTIVEEASVIKKADALTGRKAEAYEKIKDALSQGKAGGNQHELRGDLKGKSAIDLGGSGKGRGAERVIFSTNENEVIIHDIVDYHK
jgi:RHS repeat-associated protein